ncbi:hypothetical protein HMP0015_2651 [Acinetobacter haemolyticus ATCC 19194]|uniref:Uncharacterized protein n=1 Tax=Acinetobacter haemolyticus ATCC 19194 TaxID=707232 RepID=D4XSF9_ACIHA|nr:hypothetical protein HMPREF0023_0914 [Acinetobacter sp. ATCC 27244]EFF81867.1 hypothetical protein HMP0015_2651 [Acinetobacter haemolyticus ATCC 19194]
MHTPCLQVEGSTCFYVFNLAKIQLKKLEPKIKNTAENYSIDN